MERGVLSVVWKGVGSSGDNVTYLALVIAAEPCRPDYVTSEQGNGGIRVYFEYRHVQELSSSALIATSECPPIQVLPLPFLRTVSATMCPGRDAISFIPSSPEVPPSLSSPYDPHH